MTDHQVVSPDQWTHARVQLLAEEKAFTRQRDLLSAARRALPWVRVTKPYLFDGPDGGQTLAQLFGAHSQLVVYHFMFAPDWEAGCKGCSFWADNFNGIVAHLDQRDVAFVAVSRAPLAKLTAFATRLGWSFRWLSSQGCDFNYDFNVSFLPDDLTGGAAVYNYAPATMGMSDLPGVSVFCRDAEGAVFHTYSCYARGLDMLNTAYHYLDLVPKGRDEAGLPKKSAWLRLRDEYASQVPGDRR